jgi:hypothetical protein
MTTTITIENLSFPEEPEPDEMNRIKVHLVGSTGARAAYDIYLDGSRNGSKRRFLLKELVGKTFLKEEPTFSFEHPSPVTMHGIRLTPFTALICLHRNLRNQRSWSISTVEGYTKQMKAGQWAPNHQSFGFLKDEGGGAKMYDGQNRSLALLISGVDHIIVPMTFGMERSAIEGTDNGKTRALLQNALMSGLVTNSTLATLPQWNLIQAAARAIHYEAFQTKLVGAKDLATAIKAFEPDFQALAKYCRNFPASKLLRDGNTLAGFALAHHQYPVETLRVVEHIVSLSSPGSSPNEPSRRLALFLGANSSWKEVRTKSFAGPKSSKVIYKILHGVAAAIDNRDIPSLDVKPATLHRFYAKRSDIIAPAVTNETRAAVH